MNFTFKHYEDCLQMIALTTTEVEMIHDIDYEPNNVKRIAELENAHGIRSTYFIRLHAKTYNALTLDNLKLWRHLLGLGHRLGLHFEPSLCDTDIKDRIMAEVKFLEQFVGCTISCFSLHEPARMGTLKEDQIPSGLTYYCYDAPYYSGKKYISDSGCRWREGDMSLHIGNHDRLIINTHPNWWYEKTSAENY